jgi:chorismate synthase
MGNTFGTLFRITTFGESHGGGVGVVVDGCPPKIPISAEEIQFELDRRRPGQSKITTQRKEADQVEILSGLHESGVTLGTPIAMLVRNQDARSHDYDEMKDKYRPSHADFTYDQKYGIRAWQGGGRSSARETIGRVAAGAIAKKVLRELWGVEVLGFVERVQNVSTEVDPLAVTLEQVESNIVRCPDQETAERMVELIEAVRKDGNSVGGAIRCVAKNVPSGWGEPVFDRLEADLAKACLSLPACKGFESGSGFAGTYLTGLEHNDPFRAGVKRQALSVKEGTTPNAQRPTPVFTPTNNSGGIQGGISNGMPILIRAAFKPTATVMRDQDTVDTHLENTTLKGRGRHDPCVLPRAVPMVEAMVALVLLDHGLRQRAIVG